MGRRSPEQNKKASDAHRIRYRTDLTYRAKTLAASKAYRQRRYQADPAWREKVLARTNARRVKRLHTDLGYREAINERRRTRLRGTVRECVIEKYLVDKVELLGGFCPKFIDAGRRGAPDRLVVVPGSPVHFVELKRPAGGRVAAWQKRYHERLRACGQKVWVLSSIEMVDDFLLAL